MVKEEIMKQVAALDAKAAQILADANFVNGSKHALVTLYNTLEATEKAEADKPKE